MLDWVKRTHTAATGLDRELRSGYVAHEWEEFLPWLRRALQRDSPRLVRDAILACDRVPKSRILRGVSRGEVAPPTYEMLQGWREGLARLKPSTIAAHSNAGNIHDFSPWLATYRSSSYSLDNRIEMPQSWSGEPPPRSSERVFVQTVSSQMLVLRSMRVPRRITLYGSDDNSYRFLAKAGEDIRLDNRIAGLLNACNKLSRKHAPSR